MENSLISCLGLNALRNLRHSIENVVNHHQVGEKPFKALALALFHLLAGDQKMIEVSPAILNAANARFNEHRWDLMREEIIEALEVFQGKAIDRHVFQALFTKIFRLLLANFSASPNVSNSLTRFLIVVFSQK